ncbi:MAG: DUF6080 domain-containing protein [Prevotella sp.]|jgi:hypothetical protein
MKKIFKAFKIRREERWPACVALLYILVLNGLVISRYADKFMALSDNYHRLALRVFHISGFDPLTYSVVSSWGTDYNIYRHPLLAFMMYVPYLVNRGLMWLTGANCVQFVVASIVVFCAFYAFVFLCRIFRDVMGLPCVDAWILGGLTYSFAFVMLSACVPDHFIMSMLMLVFTLYVAGRKMKDGRLLTRWQTVGLFFLTAGISLNNGIKVFLAALFVNGKRFWRPIYLLPAVIIPSMLIWGLARMEWRIYERPHYAARQQKKAEVAQKRRDKVEKTFMDTTKLTDTVLIRASIERILAQKAEQRRIKNSQKAWNKNIGKPIANGEFSQWTDITTPRWPSIVENLFGESIQLHKDYLLKDNLTSRPVIVKYRLVINYIVEGAIVLLFLLGIWCGRRSRFLWLALSFWGFDMFIHVVLGFGLNEVYIMGAHWLFVLPIAMGYLFKAMAGTKSRLSLRLVVLTLTAFLMVWNWTLFIDYLL